MQKNLFLAICRRTFPINNRRSTIQNAGELVRLIDLDCKCFTVRYRVFHEPAQLGILIAIKAIWLGRDLKIWNVWEVIACLDDYVNNHNVKFGFLVFMIKMGVCYGRDTMRHNRAILRAEFLVHHNTPCFKTKMWASKWSYFHAIFTTTYRPTTTQSSSDGTVIVGFIKAWKLTNSQFRCRDRTNAKLLLPGQWFRVW